MAWPRARGARAWAAVLLAMAVCIAAPLVRAANDDNVGVVHLSKVVLVDVTTDPLGTSISEVPLYDASALLQSGTSSRASEITVNWMGIVGEKRLKVCWNRYVGTTYSGNAIAQPLTQDGPFNLGLVSLNAKLFGLATNFDELLDGNSEVPGQVVWNAGESGEKCLVSAGVLPYASGFSAASNCVTDQFTFTSGGEAEPLVWAVMASSFTSGDITAEVLDGWNKLRVNVRAESFEGSVALLDPTDNADPSIGVLDSSKGTYESQAVFIQDLVTTCPPTLDSSSLGAWSGYPDRQVRISWDPTYSFTNLRIDCATFDCVCDAVDPGQNPNCDVMVEVLDFAGGLDAGKTWQTQPRVGSPLTFNTGINAYELILPGTACGADRRMRLRVSLFTHNTEADHSHYGKLTITQDTDVILPVCQNFMSLNPADFTSYFHTIDNDFDRHRPAQAAQLTGDFTTKVSGVSYNANTGKYSYTMTGRMWTEEQFDELKIQRHLNVLSMGSCYQPTGTGADANKFLFDDITENVCINVPAAYFSNTTDQWAPKSIGGNAASIHDFLFQTAMFPPLADAEALGTSKIGDSTGYNTYPTPWALYPVNVDVSNTNSVVRDATIELTAGGGNDDVEDDVWEITYEFSGTMPQLQACVVPGTSTSQVTVTNGGDVLDDTTNQQYKWSSSWLRATYLGNRVNDELYALSGNDVCHTTAFTVTQNAVTGALVTAQSQSVSANVDLLYARYAQCSATPTGCTKPDASNPLINLPSGHDCDSSTYQPRQLELKLMLEIREADSNSIRDLGLVNDASKFTKGNDVNCYVAGPAGAADFELVSITYGASASENDGMERTRDANNNKWSNRFFVTYRTACVDTYNADANAGAGAIMTDTFNSCLDADAASTFDVRLTMQRVLPGINNGRWDEGFTNTLSASNTVDDSTFDVGINLVFDHSPVASTQGETLSHNLAVELAMTPDARANMGCTLANPCPAMSSSEREYATSQGYMSFVTRIADGLAVGENINLHIRDFYVAQVNADSPYLSCISGASSPDCSAGSDPDAPSSTPFDFKNLGKWTLANNLRRDLWQIWLEAPVVDGGAGFSRSVASAKNPIAATFVYARGYASTDVYAADGSGISVGSSTLCRAQPHVKTLSRDDGHGAWACEANSYCQWYTPYKVESGDGNVNLYDGITIRMDDLPIDRSMRAGVTAVAFDCTNVGARRLRSVGGDLGDYISPNGFRLVNEFESVASIVPVSLAGRKMSAVVVDGVEVGSSSSSVSFRVSTERDSFDKATSTLNIVLLVVIILGAILGVAALGVFVFLAVRKYRKAREYAPVAQAGKAAPADIAAQSASFFASNGEDDDNNLLR